MRSALVIALTFLAVSEAVGADQPIPQDVARMEERRRERLEWNRRTVQGAYDRVGKKDPRWDKPAGDAMELAARMFSEQADPEVTFNDINEPAKAAVDAGCDDPLLVYLYNRSLVGPKHPGDEEVIRRSKAWSKALAGSRYPAFRRAAALQLAGTYAVSKDLNEASQNEAEHDFDEALVLLPESVANDERNGFWEDRWFDALNSIIAGYRKIGMDAPAAYERVDAKLAPIPELKVLRLQVRGHFWFMYGWEARTKAFAPAVPAGGFALFEERLGKAKEAFEEAWQLRPDDARTAADLLDIDKGIGGHRATMERWFERAMKADGDRYGACFSKLDWLDPKWHGTDEEMIAFGRACRATKNSWAGITLLVGDAHLRHCGRLEPAERGKYMRSPEVWDDIRSVYDEYLNLRPHNDVARTKYAVLAYLGGHYRVAHFQFQKVGDRLAVWPTFPFYPLEGMKRMRDHAAQIVATQAREKDAAND